MSSRMIHEGRSTAWCLALGALGAAACEGWPIASDTGYRVGAEGVRSDAGGLSDDAPSEAATTGAGPIASSSSPGATSSGATARDAAAGTRGADAGSIGDAAATSMPPIPGSAGDAAGSSVPPADASSPPRVDGAAFPSAEGGASDAGGSRASNASSNGWKPKPGTTWQWQLQGTLDTTLNVAMYDIDMFGTSAAVIAALKKRGVAVVCYVDVGTWEPGRPDATEFPAAVLGHAVSGWPGEQWLDVRSSIVHTIMQNRFASASQKGCQGIEPDNVDGFENGSGFPITAADQLAYDRWVAGSVHALGMAVGLKNDTGQVAALEPDFDFELDEQCFAFGECDALAAFVDAGKAVFEVEYGAAGLATSVCPQARAKRFDALIKHLALDAWRVPCE